MIREYRESDRVEFMSLYIRSNSQGQSYLPLSFWAKDAEEVVGEHLPLSKTWLHVEEGQVLGAISLVDGEIAGLFVSPDHWRLGIGTALMERAKKESPRLRLTVFKLNAGAISFYSKAGFVIDGESVCPLTGLETYEMNIRQA